MKPPSQLHPQQRRDNPPSSGSGGGYQHPSSRQPASTDLSRKAPGPGPGGGSSSGYSSSVSSSSSSQRQAQSSSSQRPALPGGNSLQRPHPPKLNLNQPPSTPESPDVNDILKEMKFAAVTPLTAIAATPRKESSADHFDFDSRGPLHHHHPPIIRRMVSSSSGGGLLEDLNISDSDQDSEVESIIKPNATSVSSVLSPLRDPPLISVPSPLGPLTSPPHTRLQSMLPSPAHSSAAPTAAPSEAEDSEEDSSSESEGSSSDSSSNHSEPDLTKVSSSPKVSLTFFISIFFVSLNSFILLTDAGASDDATAGSHSELEFGLIHQAS